MGVCMKDHPEDDILEKIEEVRDQLSEELIAQLMQGLQQKRWAQPALNEIFHLLKKLEKKISDEERSQVLLSLADRKV